MSGPLGQATVKPCSRCGRPTRDARVKESNAPGTVIRKGTICTTCSHARSQGTDRESRLSDKPLTADEQRVIRAIERECKDDAAEVVAMLGLTREGVPA